MADIRILEYRCNRPKAPGADDVATRMCAALAEILEVLDRHGATIESDENGLPVITPYRSHGRPHVGYVTADIHPDGSIAVDLDPYEFMHDFKPEGV
jgi:hypothetical protein